MNRTYLVVPALAMAGFAAYFFLAKPQPSTPAVTRPVDPYAARDGQQEAEAELAAGKLVLIETGPGVSWDPERRELAATKYGVELRRLAEASSEGFARYVDAFNRVMRPKVMARHGRGFFDALHRDAIALHEARAAKSPPASPADAPRRP